MALLNQYTYNHVLRKTGLAIYLRKKVNRTTFRAAANLPQTFAIAMTARNHLSVDTRTLGSPQDS